MASKSKQLRVNTTRQAQHEPVSSNNLTRLNKEQQQNPAAILEEFFSNYHLPDIRECLWDWLAAALTSESGTYQTGRARGSLLFLYENIEALAEAAFILHQRRMGSKATTKGSYAKKAASEKKLKKR